MAYHVHKYASNTSSSNPPRQLPLKNTPAVVLHEGPDNHQTTMGLSDTVMKLHTTRAMQSQLFPTTANVLD